MIVMQVVIMPYLHTCALVPAIASMMLKEVIGRCLEKAVKRPHMVHVVSLATISTDEWMPHANHGCRCQCAYALQSYGTDANNIRGLAHPFEVPRKMAESGSSLCTMTPLRASVVPSLHLFSRWRAARGALSSNTSMTRRPANHLGLQ